MFTVYLCRYMAANQRCKTAEETINSETRNVERYSKLVEERFNEVQTNEITFLVPRIAIALVTSREL